ncbi:IS66 family transposase zinc-finger binding domain-containing protein, partial [Paenibacillus sp. MZ04-78.2]|uniref:IS66 family transposase n=1 Tax=Paenibacillus sp. MZ04-78.2 TaxID=2962034 RepID=UPI0020B8741E
LKQKTAKQEKQIAELSAKLKWYEEQFRLTQHRRFGASSEQTHPDQLTLFNEAEAEANPAAPEPTVETVTYKRKKSVGAREAKLDSLPVETIEYRLSEDEQVCSCCGGKLHEMSTEVRRELTIILPQVKVEEQIRYVYGCRYCEKEAVSTPIVTAPMPAPVIPGSLVSPSMM